MNIYNDYERCTAFENSCHIRKQPYMTVSKGDLIYYFRKIEEQSEKFWWGVV